MKTDVVVIGGGVAGLTAALIAAELKKSVVLIAAGAGTLPLSGGVIDVMGRTLAGHVTRPREAIDSLPMTHPYKKIGLVAIESALRWFLEFSAKQGFPYHGSLDAQIPVATVMGTIKPTCLAPNSLDGTKLFNAEKIVIIGVRGLKDFYPQLLAASLQKRLAKKIICREVVTDWVRGRDINMTDIARRLDDNEGRRNFVEQIAPLAESSTVFLTGQMLGLQYTTVGIMRDMLGIDIIETTGLPPAVNGLRLSNMYSKAIADAGVEVVRGAKVTCGTIADGYCKSVTVQAAARERIYEADLYVLATGGFYSGGIEMKRFGEPRECVFNLPVSFTDDGEHWANEDIFADAPQNFALAGIAVDDNLRPVDNDGNVIAENIRVIGRNLAGYDYCFEHSGNGVALASAYKAITDSYADCHSNAKLS